MQNQHTPQARQSATLNSNGIAMCLISQDRIHEIIDDLFRIKSVMNLCRISVDAVESGVAEIQLDKHTVVDIRNTIELASDRISAAADLLDGIGCEVMQ